MNSERLIDQGGNAPLRLSVRLFTPSSPRAILHHSSFAIRLCHTACTGLALVAFLSACIGCGSDNPLGRLSISGEILLDGQPIDTGSIEFSPHEHSGVRTGTIITNGAYAIPAEKGLPPGKYLVRIFSPVEATAAPAEPSVPGPTAPGPVGPSQPPPGVERIPPKYNEESKEVIEITEAGPNEFDFDIQTK